MYLYCKQVCLILLIAAVSTPLSFLWAIEKEAAARPMEAYSHAFTPAAELDRVDSEGISGHLPVRARLSVSGVYDDNIFISNRNEVEDWIWTITPGISYESSDPDRNLEHFLAASYDPSIVLFMDNDDQDALEHDARFRYHYKGDKLLFTAGQSFQRLSGSTNDAGNRIDRDIFDTLLTANYQVTGKSQLELEAAQNITSYDDPAKFDSKEWSGGLFWMYQMTPKMTLGVGPTIGFADIEGNPNQTYQQGIIRLNYIPTEKITITARGGLEAREYQESDDVDLYPVLSMKTEYRPFDGTEMSLEAYRRAVPSAVLAGQNYISTGLTARIRQRLYQKYYLGLAGGFENSDYQSTARRVNANRDDDYLFIRPSFEWQVTDWWMITAFYEFRDNNSNIGNNEFVSNRAGVQTTFSY